MAQDAAQDTARGMVTPGGAMSSRPDVTEGDVNVSGLRMAWSAELPTATRELLARDEAAFMRQALSTPCLDAAGSVSGSTITTLGGHRLLDFHGNSVHQVGHAHPRVLQAVRAQLDTLAFCPRRFTNEPAVQLAERLGATSPGGKLTKVLFAPAGAEAMSMAMKLARLATGRSKFISFVDSFHGATLDTISIGGERHFREGVGPLLPGCIHVQAPAARQCSRGCVDTCSNDCVAEIEKLLANDRDIAAVIAEPMRCTTVDLAPAGYWQRVRAACDRHGALLVFDEIPLCLGRTGKMYSCEHEGVVPDVLVMGKGLGGGVMPMAAMLCRPELDVCRQTSLGHFTHEKSPLGAAAGLAVLNVIRDERLLERSETLGRKLMERLRELAEERPGIRQVRGRGLLVGVELQRGSGDGSQARSTLYAESVMYECLRRGLSFKVSGGTVLTLTPPLTVSEQEMEIAVEILSEALAAPVRE